MLSNHQSPLALHTALYLSSFFTTIIIRVTFLLEHGAIITIIQKSSASSLFVVIERDSISTSGTPGPSASRSSMGWDWCCHSLWIGVEGGGNDKTGLLGVVVAGWKGTQCQSFLHDPMCSLPVWTPLFTH